MYFNPLGRKSPADRLAPFPELTASAATEDGAQAPTPSTDHSTPGHNAFAYLVGLHEAHVVKVVVQPLDLLRQLHFEQADSTSVFFCLHSANKVGKREGVIPSDCDLRSCP